MSEIRKAIPLSEKEQILFKIEMRKQNTIELAKEKANLISSAFRKQSNEDWAKSLENITKLAEKEETKGSKMTNEIKDKLFLEFHKKWLHKKQSGTLKTNYELPAIKSWMKRFFWQYRRGHWVIWSLYATFNEDKIKRILDLNINIGRRKMDRVFYDDAFSVALQKFIVLIFKRELSGKTILSSTIKIKFFGIPAEKIYDVLDIIYGKDMGSNMHSKYGVNIKYFYADKDTLMRLVPIGIDIDNPFQRTDAENFERRLSEKIRMQNLLQRYDPTVEIKDSDLGND
jgi:hypothetical protein